MTPVLAFLAAISAAWYVLIVRPQRSQQHRHDSVLAQLTPGCSVMTIGGIYGRVLEVDADSAVVEMAPGMTSRIAKDGIARIVQGDRVPDGVAAAGAPQQVSQSQAPTVPGGSMSHHPPHHHQHDPHAGAAHHPHAGVVHDPYAGVAYDQYGQPYVQAPQVAHQQPFPAVGPSYAHAPVAQPQHYVAAPAQQPLAAPGQAFTLRAVVDTPQPASAGEWQPSTWSASGGDPAGAAPFHAQQQYVQAAPQQHFEQAPPPQHHYHAPVPAQHHYATSVAVAAPQQHYGYAPVPQQQHVAPASYAQPVFHPAPEAAPPAPDVVPEHMRRRSKAPEGMGQAVRMDGELAGTFERARREREELANEFRRITSPMVGDGTAVVATHQAHAPAPQSVPLFVAQQGHAHGQPIAQYPPPAELPAVTVQVPRPAIGITGRQPAEEQPAAFQRPTPYAPSALAPAAG